MGGCLSWLIIGVLTSDGVFGICYSYIRARFDFLGDV